MPATKAKATPQAPHSLQCVLAGQLDRDTCVGFRRTHSGHFRDFAKTMQLGDPHLGPHSNVCFDVGRMQCGPDMPLRCLITWVPFAFKMFMLQGKNKYQP